MLEVTHVTKHVKGIIRGRTDHDLRSLVRQAKKDLGITYKAPRTYLIDHEFVNAVFRRKSTGTLYVCRSVVKQWNYTAYCLTGTFIQHSGSSFAHTLHSYNTSALLETEHAHEFWNDHELVRFARERVCVYCGAIVMNSTHYTCGMSRSYDRELNQCGDAFWVSHNNSTVHPSFKLEQTDVETKEKA